MAKAELVGEDYETARKLLQSLDELAASVRTAFWWYSGDSGEWKLVLAMPDVDKHGAKYAYNLVRQALERASLRTVFLRDISIFSPSHEIVKSISKTFHLEGAQAPIRIKNSASGNVFIEDAHVFRST